MYRDQLTENEIKGVYDWVDTFELSRPKRNISRDFSDGKLVAELIHRYHSHLVEIHNYPDSSKIDGKKRNWATLQKKVFKKLGIKLNKELLEDIVTAEPLAIELFLNDLKSILQTKRINKPKLNNVIFEHGNVIEEDGPL